jgi:hypothetical protein
MALVRVYHPETNEPFDVPEAKATELRLQFGWLSTAFTEIKSEALKLETEVKTEAQKLVADVEKIVSPAPVPATAPVPKV